jgi:hypothetical protein
VKAGAAETDWGLGWAVLLPQFLKQGNDFWTKDRNSILAMPCGSVFPEPKRDRCLNEGLRRDGSNLSRSGPGQVQELQERLEISHDFRRPDMPG